MKSQVFRISAALMLGLMLLVSGGCKKDRAYQAKVIVKYAVDGSPAAQAFVETGCPVCEPNTPPTQMGQTDANGEVLFEFPAKMVLDVTATKANLTGAGFLQLEEGQTVVETIYIQ
jgi:hypothetical protein